MKKDAYYFSHDSNARNDPKILKLRVKHGMRGYGIFWSLIEMLRDQSDYCLLSDFESIAFSLNESPDIVSSVITDFGLFKFSGDSFFSESLNERMSIKEEKSNKARDAANKRWDKKSNADAMQTHSKRNANPMQLKESKVNEIKVNKIKLNNDLYTAFDSKELFNNQSLNGNFLKKMSEIYSCNIDVINQELEKWISLNENNNFKDLKHLQNSFNTWMRNYKPLNGKTKKIEDEPLIKKLGKTAFEL
jgi:hypothetical protein